MCLRVYAPQRQTNRPAVSGRGHVGDVREALADETVLSRAELGGPARHEDIWGSSVGRKATCDGPDTRICLAQWGHSKKAPVAATDLVLEAGHGQHPVT